MYFFIVDSIAVLETAIINVNKNHEKAHSPRIRKEHQYPLSKAACLYRACHDKQEYRERAADGGDRKSHAIDEERDILVPYYP